MRISVLNQKGGVGKTTTAINTAHALANRGRDVLVVDLDPQGNLTEAVGEPAAYDSGPPTLLEALTDSSQRDTINEIRQPTDHGVDLIPSALELTAAEPELTVSRRSGERLRMALDELEDPPEIVLVDPPPSLGHLVDNAMLAAPNLIVPALAESTSQRALELLYDHREALNSDFDVDIRTLGIVLNRIDVRKGHAQDMEDWINNIFDDLPVWRIRDRVAIQDAIEAQEPIQSHDPNCDQIETYDQIASSIEEMMNQ